MQQFPKAAHLIISASLYCGSVFSMKHANASSQWNEPLCVPIFTILRNLLTSGDWLIDKPLDRPLLAAPATKKE